MADEINAVEVYEVLREKIGEEGAKSLIRYVDEKIERRVATKDDLEKSELSLKNYIDTVRSDLEKQINSVKYDLEKQINSVRSDLEKQINSVRSDLEKQIDTVRFELERRLDTIKADLEKRIASSDWKTRLYFAVLAVLIVVTNPKVLELVGKVLGIAK